MASVVTVAGGVVTNAAGNNLNPAIQMNGGLGNNVVVGGGTVQSTSSSGYALQTTGNVAVSGGLVVAAGTGRAINLVGMDSIATVSGGTVQTTGTGSAISTATTAPGTVTRASVVVTGGLVTAVNGNAINITGADSAVTVSGGTVRSTGSGNAIDTANSLAGGNSKITVNGSGVVSAASGSAIYTITNSTNAVVEVSGNAKVSSSTGYAIRTLSAGSSVTTGANCQVWVFKADNAIRASGTLTLNGGFIFAYGTNATNVISPTGAPNLTVLASGSVFVVAWNRANNVRSYPQGVFPIAHPDDNEDLDIRYHGTFADFWWHNNPELGGGINYSYGATTGFFPLSEVTIRQDYGLIYDASTSWMHLNIDGTGIPGTGMGSPNRRIFPLSYGNAWVEDRSNPDYLVLQGFSWKTHAPVALMIHGGPVTIHLKEGTTNTFESTPPSGSSRGIYAWTADDIIPNQPITIEGGGTLKATGGGASNSASSFGVDCANFTFSGGTIEARGNTRGFSDSPNLPVAYRWWRNTANADPGGAGTPCFTGATPYGSPYVYSTTHRFVRITTAPFAAINDTTVAGIVGEALVSPPGPVTISLYNETVGAALSGTDVSGWFKNLPSGVVVRATAAAGSSAITLTFAGIPHVGSTAVFDIAIPGAALASGNGCGVILNNNARFAITASYDLLVTTRGGGFVSGTPSGRYDAGEPIRVTAKAEKGYRFTGWTVNGAAIRGGTSVNPAAFNMPGRKVVLRANFARIAPAGDTDTDDGAEQESFTRAGGSGSDTNANAASGGFPRTGDGANPLAWTLALIASALGLIAGLALAARRRKKRTRHYKEQ